MFSSLRGTNCKTTHYLLPCFFKLSALKGDAKAPAVDLLGLNTLRGTKTAFLIPEKVQQAPLSLLYRSYPWGKAVIFITFSGSTTSFSEQNQNKHFKTGNKNHKDKYFTNL